jgi:hypothetical protein
MYAIAACFVKRHDAMADRLTEPITMTGDDAKPTSSDKVDALLSRFPEPVTRWPDRLNGLRGLALILPAIGIVLSGVLPMRPQLKIPCLLPLICLALLAVLMLLPGAFRLTLDKDGYERVVLFLSFRKFWKRTNTTTFQRISNWRIGAAGVRLESTAHSAGPRVVGNSGRASIGRIAALGNSYNLSTKEFIALMSQWRARSLGQQA